MSLKNPKIPFNIIIVILVVFAMIGLYWLQKSGLSAGGDYLWLLIIGMVFIGISFVAYLKSKDFYFEIPINKGNDKAVLMLLFGSIIILGVFFVSKVTGLFLYNPMFIAPLATFSTGVGATTFSALQAATSPFWTFFIIVFCAAVIEELTLGWGAMNIGALVAGKGIRNLLSLDIEHYDWWDFFMAMIFSMVFFSALHFFNGTYKLTDGSWNWSMFTIAAGFRALMNMMIFKFGNFGLCFSIGVHAMNNALYLGGLIVVTAFTTFPGGYLIVLFLALVAYYFIMNISSMFREGKFFAKDFLTFD